MQQRSPIEKSANQEIRLTDAEVTFLRELEDYYYIFQGGIDDASELAMNLGSQVLKSLEKQGLITIVQRYPDDQRVESARTKTITITDSGKAAIRNHPALDGVQQENITPEVALAIANLHNEKLSPLLRYYLQSLPILEKSVQFYRAEENETRRKLAEVELAFSGESVAESGRQVIKGWHEMLARSEKARREAEKRAIEARSMIVEYRKAIERAQIDALRNAEPGIEN